MSEETSVKGSPVRGSTPTEANSSNSAVSWLNARSTRSSPRVVRALQVTTLTRTRTAVISRTSQTMMSSRAGIRRRWGSSG